MIVRELIEKLKDFDQDAEVHIPFDGFLGDSIEACEVYAFEDERGYLCAGGPTKHKAVLICTGSEGL